MKHNRHNANDNFPKISEQEFINRYCEQSCIEWEELSKTQTVMRCFCGEDDCHGFAMVDKDKKAYERHIRLYGKG